MNIEFPKMKTLISDIKFLFPIGKSPIDGKIKPKLFGFPKTLRFYFNYILGYFLFGGGDWRKIFYPNTIKYMRTLIDWASYSGSGGIMRFLYHRATIGGETIKGGKGLKF